MKKRNLLMSGIAVVLTAGLFAYAYAADDEEDYTDDTEEAIAFSALPESVRKAAEAFFGTAAGLEAEKETEDGATLYCVEGTKDGSETEIEMTESGDIVEVEQDSSFAKLPSSVQRKLRQDYPGAEFGEVEAVQLRFYAVKLRAKDGEKEIRVFASGKVEDEQATRQKLASAR